MTVYRLPIGATCNVALLSRLPGIVIVPIHIAARWVDVTPPIWYLAACASAATPSRRRRPDPEREIPRWLDEPNRRYVSRRWLRFFLVVAIVAAACFLVRNLAPFFGGLHP